MESSLPVTPSTTKTNSSPKKKDWFLIGILILLIVSLATTGLLAYQNFQLKKQLQQAQQSTTPTPTAVTPAPSFTQTEQLTTPTPTTITPTPNPTANWKTYRNEAVTFKFPSSWEEKPVVTSDSGYTQEFNDPQNKYTLTFSSLKNYNPATGEPYASIDEYINMPYKVKAVTIDGQDGRQPLPRAGSEHIIAVMFFSKDSRNIYTLKLQTGNNPMDTNEAKAKEAQKLFDQILSTFKFSD